jgi:TolB-like protein/Tfp pilus assembly protein PilF
LLYGAAAGLILAAVAIALILLTGPADAIDSIAVLPLENRTGDAEQEFFVDGLTEELIGHLAQISGLRRVISRTTMMRFKDTDRSLPEIARELNVDTVVEGTVYEVGENVRLNLQVFDALPEERILLAQTYERPGTDVLMMCGEIARAITGKLQVELIAEEETRFAKARQVNPQAYEAYLKGMSHVYKLTPPGIDAALHYFEKALEADPNYALAYAGIALVWTARQQMGLLIPSEATPKAKEAAQRALELDDTLPEIHYMLAGIKTWNDWNWEGGEQSFKRALELNPNHAEGLVFYSNLLCYMGRLDEALAMAERAVQLDPLNSILLTVSSSTFLYLHRYDDAIALCQNALRTSPHDPIGYSGLWEAYYAKGMYEESLESARAFFSGLGFNEIAEIMARGYDEDGFNGAMMSAAETMEVFSQQTYVSPYSIARMFVKAGDKEKTMEWLEIGYEMKDPMMPYVSSLTYDFLDDDPRYQDLLRRMGLPTHDKKPDG